MIIAKTELGKICTSRKMLPSLQNLRVSALLILIALGIITLLAHSRHEDTSATPHRRANALPVNKTASKQTKNKTLVNISKSEEFEILDVNDPSVTKAAHMVRSAINAYRLRDCPNIGPYNTPGNVKYAKRRFSAKGNRHFYLEISFGPDIVFGRVVAHLPSSEKKKEGRYEFLKSVPSPCYNATTDQLAISQTGI